MEELGRALPGSEGFVDAEQNTLSKQHNEFCLNCGTKLQDTFCQHCGQKDIPKRQTLGELWTNFISSFWSYEGKFFLTTRFLITKPGFLAVEYNSGKRESYYHPARMYVFISFVFFLFFSMTSNMDDVVEHDSKLKLDKEDIAELKEDHPKLNIDSLLKIAPGDTSKNWLVSQKLLDSIGKLDKRKKSNVGFSLTDNQFKTVTQYDSAQNALPEDKRDNWIERRFNLRSIELSERYADKDFGKDFGQAFLDNFSKVLFFLLPVFALLLKLLYIRRDYFYSEHLVFSIYYYNFFYLAGSLQILAGFAEHITVFDWIKTIIGFWIFFYLLFAMKRMYGQGWGKTIFKFLIFGFLFTICIGIGFSISAIFLLFAI